MKHYVPLLILLMLFPGLASCCTEIPELPPQVEQPPEPDNPPIPNEPGTDNEENENNDSNEMGNKLNIRIGTSAFTLTLEDNAAAKAFKKLLPMTLNMSELNGNEKYFNLKTDLPSAASRPGTIRTGDLMLFGSNTLVLFYETFSSSYSYTRIGKVDNSSELAHVLGSGNVTVLFETTRN